MFVFEGGLNLGRFSCAQVTETSGNGGDLTECLNGDWLMRCGAPQRAERFENAVSPRHNEFLGTKTGFVISDTALQRGRSALNAPE